MSLRVVFLVMSVLIGWEASVAAQTATALAKSDQTKKGAETSTHFLHVTINPSTANIIAGAVYGLDAELENVSSVPISIDLNKIELAVQPELAPPNVVCTWFYDAGSNNKIASPVKMQPGDRYTVFFDTGASATDEDLKKEKTCVVGALGHLRKRLDFAPGNYNFVVTGTFSFIAQPGEAASTSTAESQEHYFTETASLPVTIDQFQIILYSGLGGLLAFLVMTFRTAGTLLNYADQKTDKKYVGRFSKFLFIIRRVTGAFLLSATVSVVAARLSSTAFPVKVSVEDFWGALTVGFVAYFVGGKFIDKLSQTLSTNESTPSPTPTPAPTPFAGTTTTTAASKTGATPTGNANATSDTSPTDATPTRTTTTPDNKAPADSGTVPTVESSGS